MATAGAVSVAVELGVSPEGGCLAQRLSEIAASVAPEDMLEPALRAIVTESGAAAGALCFFDSRQDLLRLAAEVGLSDEGCRQLRAVRRGAATGWDIPLHGLVNRRAYLIDSAAQNRYVPPLVEPPGSMRAIVCIPLHSGPSPVGSLILVAVAPRSFGERDIHALEAPLGVLVKMIQATRRRGGEQTSPRAAAPAPPAAPSPAPGKPEGADADRVQLLIASLAATERERSRLATAVEAAAAERAEHARVQATLETRAVEQAAEVQRLTERLASEQARLQAALDTAAAEHTAEVQRLTEGLASEHSRLRAAETAAAEHAAEVQRLTERLGPEQARFQAALEAAAAEVERLTAQVASEQTRFEAALEAAAAQRAAEIERLTEGFAPDRARLEMALETSTAEVERLTAHLASDRARFEAALEAAAAEHAAEVERLTRRLESAVEAEERRRVTERTTSVTAPEPPASDPVPETPPPDVKQATRVPSVPPREGVVAVLDTGAAWPSAGPGGESVTVVSPDAGAAVRITELAPRCLVANLAAPGALEALAALRAAGSTTRVRGCLAATEHAVSLGAVEAIARPLDADAIQRALGAHASRGARILIVGTDVDFFAALREALGRGGLSVSMAWDAHQVDDLLDMVRPDIALIDLALGSRDVRPIVAKLASLEPVPTVAFVLGTDPAAPHFRAAMTYPIVATRAKPLDQLLAKVFETKGPIDGRR